MKLARMAASALHSVAHRIVDIVAVAVCTVALAAAAHVVTVPVAARMYSVAVAACLDHVVVAVFAEDTVPPLARRPYKTLNSPGVPYRSQGKI